MSVKKIYKPKNFFFFFHKKYDTGTWTIVFASITLTMYLGIFLFALAYSFPKCFCKDPYPHFNVLPIRYVILYIIFLIVLLAGIISCVLAIYGTFKARLKMLRCFIFAECLTEIVVFAASIMVISWLAKMDQYLLFSNDTYMDVTKMILKEEIATKVEGVMNSVASLMEAFFSEISVAPTTTDDKVALNLNSLMDALLNDYILGLLGGLKLIMKCGTVLCCIGLNFIFTCGSFTAVSHYLRLKNGDVSPYHSSIPGCLINSAVMTNSARSTATESLNDDWSTTASNHKSVPRNYVYSNSNHPDGNGGFVYNSRNHTTNTNKSRKSRNHKNGSSESLRSDHSRRSKSTTTTGHRQGSKRHNLSVVGQFPPDRFL